MASNPAEIMAAGQSLVPNYADQELRRQMGQLQLQGATLQNQAQAAALADHKRAIDRQAAFATDFTGYLAHPTTTGLISLFGNHPEFHDQIKEAHAALDEDEQRVNTTQLGSVAALAAKGDFTGAAGVMQRRIAADRAAGHDVSDDQAILDHLTDPDPAKQKAALALTTIALAGAVGPEKAASFLKANGLSSEPFTLSQGEVRYGADGQPIASVAPKPDYLIIPEGGKAVPVGPGGPQGTIQGNPSAPAGGGGPASGGGAGGHGKYATTTEGVVVNGRLDPHAFFNNVMSHYEGGYNAHDLNGSPVNFGINQGANPGVDVKSLTRDQAAQIFAEKYFGPSGAANLPPALAAVHADTYFMNERRAAQFLAQSGGDPQRYMDLREAWMQRLEAKHPEVATAWNTRNADLRNVAAQLSGGAATAPSSAPSPTARPGDPPGTIYGNTKPGYTLLNPQQAEARGLNPGKTWQVGPDGQTTAVGDAPAAIAPGNTNATGDAYLASLPPALANRIKGIVAGRLPYPPQGRTTNNSILAAISQYAPGFDATTWQRRKETTTAYAPGGKVGQSLISAKTLINHIYEMAQASEHMGGVGFTPFNAVVNAGRSLTSDPDLIRYNESRKFVATELPKFLGGKAPTEAEIAHNYDSYSPNIGPDGRKTALGTDVQYLFGRLQPILDAYKDAMGADYDIDRAVPGGEVSHRIAALENWVNGGKLAPPSRTMGTHPQGGATSGLPAGAKLIGKRADDGRPVYQLPNGQKVSPR